MVVKLTKKKKSIAAKNIRPAFTRKLVRIIELSTYDRAKKATEAIRRMLNVM